MVRKQPLRMHYVFLQALSSYKPMLQHEDGQLIECTIANSMLRLSCTFFQGNHSCVISNKSPRKARGSSHAEKTFTHKEEKQDI